MPKRDSTSGPPPVDLFHAVRGEISSSEYHGGDYTWGYRIYRTTYNQPNSDADFARAIEVLNEYMRAECFTYSKGHSTTEYVDGEANRQLWQRMKHDIVQDPDLLEGASASPEKLLKLHQDWVHTNPGARITDSSYYRHFLVIDDEVINHLLQLPMPAEYEHTIPTMYAVKLFDAWSNVPWDLYDCDPVNEPEEDAEDEDLADYEGWFWMSAFELVHFWFCEEKAAVEELSVVDDCWGGQWRPVHVDSPLLLEGMSSRVRI